MGWSNLKQFVELSQVAFDQERQERQQAVAALLDDEAFAGRMGGIANNVSNARGREFFSPVEMSRQAPFVDAATAVDQNNRNNTFLSYYTWGSGIAMALDLTLRADVNHLDARDSTGLEQPQ